MNENVVPVLLVEAIEILIPSHSANAHIKGPPTHTYITLTQTHITYFITPGMLSSHDSMSLERLHAMLRLLASGGGANEVKFDMNMVQLRRFLQSLVDADKLEFSDNVYRIRK
jgi:Anaphase promoting complex (APC) subunit 2